MEKILDSKQLLRERDDKVYNNRAETKANEMKLLTGTPQIDPLSRKMAEVITQRELESLGIHPEPSQKKQFFKIPTAQAKKHSNLSTLEKSPEAAQPIFELKSQGLITRPTTDDQPESLPILIQKSLETPSYLPITDYEKPTQSPDQVYLSQLSPNSQDQILKDAENIQAFQEELQREYPELALNEDEGSSFHTNELNELEEACRDLDLQGLDSPKNSGEKAERVQEKIENLEISDKTIENSDKTIEKNVEVDTSATKTDSKAIESLKTPKKSQSIRLVRTSVSLTLKPSLHSTYKEQHPGALITLRGKTEASTVVSRTPEIIQKEAESIKKHAQNAAFLHSDKEPVNKYTPRVHLNMNTCRSSPIYFNVLAPKGARVKGECGVTSVDGLRFFLLKEKGEKIREKKDFYSRNVKWMQEKDKRIQEIRESLKDNEVIGCTFDPFFEKHEEEKKKFEVFEYKARLGKGLERIVEGNKEKGSIEFVGGDRKGSIMGEGNRRNKLSKSSVGGKVNAASASSKVRGSRVHAHKSSHINKSLPKRNPKTQVHLKNLPKYDKLSPSEQEIKYLNGFDTERIEKEGKPLIKYKKINELR